MKLQLALFERSHVTPRPHFAAHIIITDVLDVSKQQHACSGSGARVQHIMGNCRAAGALGGFQHAEMKVRTFRQRQRPPRLQIAGAPPVGHTHMALKCE
jgi:hypothetical protein